MFSARRIIATAGIAAATLGIASPAFASGTPVNSTVSVSQTLTLTGLTATVAFGTAAPGATATVSKAEQYTVSTNDTAGYSLSISDDPAVKAFKMTGGGSGLITLPNNFSIAETGSHPGTVNFDDGAASETIDPAGAVGTTSYSEDWSLAIPANATAGNYAATFTYLAVGK